MTILCPFTSSQVVFSPSSPIRTSPLGLVRSPPVPLTLPANDELCKYHQKTLENYLSSWIMIIFKVTEG